MFKVSEPVGIPYMHVHLKPPDSQKMLHMYNLNLKAIQLTISLFANANIIL